MSDRKISAVIVGYHSAMRGDFDDDTKPMPSFADYAKEETRKRKSMEHDDFLAANAYQMSWSADVTSYASVTIFDGGAARFECSLNGHTSALRRDVAGGEREIGYGGPYIFAFRPKPLLRMLSVAAIRDGDPMPFTSYYNNQRAIDPLDALCETEGRPYFGLAKFMEDPAFSDYHTGCYPFVDLYILLELVHKLGFQFSLQSAQREVRRSSAVSDEQQQMIRELFTGSTAEVVSAA